MLRDKLYLLYRCLPNDLCSFGTSASDAVAPPTNRSGRRKGKTWSLVRDARGSSRKMLSRKALPVSDLKRKRERGTEGTEPIAAEENVSYTQDHLPNTIPKVKVLHIAVYPDLMKQGRDVKKSTTGLDFMDY
ncbi:hypothetical protein EYF80_019534 [Liparis tanakae]|uniref:Uncharacterized protein n=1 Tax=Liparis tanakae TaxID=230148 RepID=A0A4Z2HXR6_9TELE|nr:hypothetical protein EYF80_019534 [Liparis tanakae]